MLPRTILFIFLLCCALGCGDDDCDDFTNPDCGNYDLCRSAPAPTANFEMYYLRSVRPLEDGEIYEVKIFVQDSTYGGHLFFNAVNDAAANYTYDWTIGFDDREENRKEWSLTFREETAEQVDITLSVTQEIIACPERGVESAERTQRIVLLDYDDPAYNVPYLGWYTGTNENEPEQPPFDIEIFRNELGGVRVRNFPRDALNDGDRNTLGLIHDYQSFAFTPNLNVCCRRAYGMGTFSSSYDSIRIEYQTWDFEAQEWIEDVFVGERKR